VQELLALIEKTSFPIIITANDIWQRKFNLLRKKCQLISVRELKEEYILEIIENILEKENKKIKPKSKELIIKKSRGDVRAALNDLQTILDLGEEEYISSEIEREKQDSIFNALKKVFQEPPDNETLGVYNNTKMELDEILLWVEENLPAEYQGSGLARAQLSLSLADLFRGRIYRQQYWRFLVYQNFFLSAGVSSATKLKSQKFNSYKRPSRILKIWLSNQKNAKRKSILAKYAKYSHMSKKKANREKHLLPLILNQIAQQELKLEEKEQR
jgi:replication factor C large subunit